MKKIRVELVKGSRPAAVRVVQQTRRNERFGPRFAFRHNGFILKSGSHPSAMTQESSEAYGCPKGGMWVRGWYKHRDADLVIVPSRGWLTAMQKAVKAYNLCYAYRCGDVL